ncbi:LacI family DNA-binding transcriptional regulator [Stackebrandtia nassauensis]|uniref:Transcriptional regulator, LacI family n=1 Tax=Stackebrandtia nassauensis (strain DSM 44728 / CIP 108903 / NRRL B-16338 / NBRC 102104 / LLR-40K-21) TaxID=446470 RepID=D3Q3D8_STANL|nr:LacI family DNA-binding transcriptional regulator [Stackebrandtia nassauensis]ADD41979.1 transcriptional regulator, LacI family [Stackebrandtia nassauensis DSM 44728]
MAETKKSNLALVAARAGVSVASVSRVLNGGSASEELTRRVREAADELGYVPDASARTLRTGRTDQIALAVADVGNPVYVQMMRAVTRIVAKADYRLVVSSTGSDPQAQIDLLTSLNRGYADGLLLSPLRITPDLIDAMRASRLPIVVIGSLPPDVELDNVRADSATGIGLAIEHLVEQGRRRIALVNGPVDTVPGAARLAGYLDAVKRFGLPDSPELQVTADAFTYRAGREATADLLRQSSPDAVVGANDLLAVAALKELNAAGARVPDDVAVVGMDDTDAAELATPSLTSVDLGSAERAKAAAELLIRRIRNPESKVRRIVITPSLSVRESSRTEAQKPDGAS